MQLGSLPAAYLPVEPESPDTAPRGGKRILIVDDERDLAEMLEMGLVAQGYQADTACTGAEALELIKTRAYDGVVLDILLPGDLDGPAVFQILRGAHPRLVERTLFITADTMNYETRRFLEQAGSPYMEKPFLITDFTARLDALLRACEEQNVNTPS